MIVLTSCTNKVEEINNGEVKENAITKDGEMNKDEQTQEDEETNKGLATIDRKSTEKKEEDNTDASNESDGDTSHNAEYLYYAFDEHQLQKQPIKDEIIYGMHFHSGNLNPDYIGTNILMGRNATFLADSLHNNDFWQVGKRSDLFNGKWHSEPIRELIANEEKYALYRELANKEYIFYGLGKKIIQSDGSLTITEHGDPFMVFDQSSQSGLFISGSYNHMPRDVNILVNMGFDGEAYTINQYSDSIDIDAMVKAIAPDIKNASITQLIECDINGDGKLERIVNINNTYAKYKNIANNWYDWDYTGYMAKLVILDEANKLIVNIDVNEKLKDPLEVGSLFPTIHYIIDVDNDGIFEIITEDPVWEGTHYVLNRINVEEKVIEQKLYYEGL